MKRILTVLLLIFMILGLTACYDDETTYEEQTIEESGFRIIEKFGDKGYTDIYLVYDPNTGAEYLFLAGYHENSICPYFNSDGTVAIYNGK